MATVRFAVLRFPGSNCDQDALYTIRSIEGCEAEYVWHEEKTLRGFDVVVVPGGFSYGDYLRCGAVARFAPVMDALHQHAEAGRPVLGICNGFQILCEAHLLPGALVRNADCRFICRIVPLEVERNDTMFTSAYTAGETIHVPIAHGEGCFVTDEATLAELEEQGRILFRYSVKDGAKNPNGSMANIAGICSSKGNVLGMMPHPERAADKLLGSEDGRRLFISLKNSL